MDVRKKRAIAIVHEFLQSGRDLPFSEQVRPQLLALSSKPVEAIDIKKLVQLIQLDSGLTTNVLQLANSAYFSGVTKIVNLRRAIVQIGIEEAINFIQMVFYRCSLPKFPTVAGGFSDKDYWSHSWACAIACRNLGHPSINSNTLPGELYIAGLLHGIGKLILAIHRPDDFAQCLENSVAFQLSLTEAQLDVFGTTDPEIACELLKVWQLPTCISTAIQFYHHPEDADKEHQEFAGLLQLSYFIANTSGVGNINDEYCYDINKTWISAQPNSLLSDKILRDEFVENIYKILRNKQATLEAIGQKENEELPFVLKHHPENNTVKHNKWIYRLFYWLKKQFQ